MSDEVKIELRGEDINKRVLIPHSWAGDGSHIQAVRGALADGSTAVGYSLDPEVLDTLTARVIAAIVALEQST